MIDAFTKMMLQVVAILDNATVANGTKLAALRCVALRYCIADAELLHKAKLLPTLQALASVDTGSEGVATKRQAQKSLMNLALTMLSWGSESKDNSHMRMALAKF